MGRMMRGSAYREISVSDWAGTYFRPAGPVIGLWITLVPLAALGQDVLPGGGTVTSGAVAIDTPGSRSMVLTQGSDRAIVNWQSFSIGEGAHVDIRQPSSHSAILNRVTGSADSRIHGRLSANGQVFVVNPNGIFIGPNGQVSAGGGFVASTLDISDSDFAAGRLRFEGMGRSAAVVNAGRVQIGRGGYGALIGGRIDNSGVVTVPLGRIGFAAGEQVTLDVSGDRFLQVAVPSKGDSDEMRALIAHSGKVSAEGGLIEMRAATARDAARNAINLSGVAEARSVSLRNGAIVLGGGGGGTVRVSGRMSASAAAQAYRPVEVATSPRPVARPTGGDITVTGDVIILAGAAIDAGGAGGGGDIRIGGDYRGGGDLQTASRLSVDAATRLSADASDLGQGGRVILWSQDHTAFRGSISARGGAAGGDGGLVEVSGKTTLAFSGLVDTRAPGGAGGRLLLDPYNVIIADAPQTGLEEVGNDFVPFAGDAIVDVTALQRNLARNNVEISTGSVEDEGGQAGSITVDAPVTWNSVFDLTLRALADIRIAQAITAPDGGLILDAVNTVITSGTGSIAVDFFALSNGDWIQNPDTQGFLAALPGFSANDFRIAQGAGFLRVAGGEGSGAAPYRISDVYGLQGLNYGGLTASDAVLIQTIDARATEGWYDFGEGTSGFVPIGQGGESGYTGSFDGAGFAIGGLFVDRPTDAGLFQSIGANGAARNLTLASVDISGANAGGLAAFNAGAVDNVAVSGAVNGSALEFDSGEFVSGGAVGGLVAENSGTVGGSSFDGAVTATANLRALAAGGLVGANLGTISGSRSGGTVDIDSDTQVALGGLVGRNAGAVADSTAQSAVSLDIVTDATAGPARVGGFAGVSGGTISDSAASGNVTVRAGAFDRNGGFAVPDVTEGDVDLDVGGFLGLNGAGGEGAGSVVAARAQNTVRVDAAVSEAYSGDVAVGGFVGRNQASVFQSRADSDVDVFVTEDNTTSTDLIPTTVRGIAGGFAGVNSGSLSQTAATGGVAARSGPFAVLQIAGAHTGLNDGGGIFDSHAQGDVLGNADIFYGTAFVGGLVGQSIGGSIARTYASGAVSGDAETPVAGGLIGTSDGFVDVSAPTAVDASYWDTDTSGLATSAGGIGLTTAQLRDTQGFLERAGEGGWDFAETWAPGTTGFDPALFALDPVLLLAADDAEGTYGQLDAVALTGSTFGGPDTYVFGPGDDSLDDVPLFTSDGLPDGDVGDYAITAGGSVTSALGQSYRTISADGTLTVVPAPALTVTVRDQTKTYGQTLVFDGTEFDVVGLVDGDSVTSITLISEGAAPGAVVAGDGYAIEGSAPTGVGLVGSQELANYEDIVFVDGRLDVILAPLVLRPRDVVKTFGDLVIFDGTEFTSEGLLLSDSVENLALASEGAARNARPADSPYDIVASDPVGIRARQLRHHHRDGHPHRARRRAGPAAAAARLRPAQSARHAADHAGDRPDGRHGRGGREPGA